MSASRSSMESFWMPFTPNRAFREKPRLVDRADGVYYWSDDGRRIIDGAAGLWCCNAGHGHPDIIGAIQEQTARMDYAPHFNLGHPAAFDAADRIAALAPDGLNKVFFTCSGSESVDTALKIALAYHRQNGEATRTRLIGRERGYHGVGFGGISVGGIGPNRVQFSGALLPGVDHLPHTHFPDHNAFSKGQPEYGAHAADALEALVALHGAQTIAAVIVEPVAGSTGVLVPPIGYLERLREICTHHGILLIFDEVITAFGRLGHAFAADAFGVTPDIITTAKGLTSGTVPMGAVIIRDDIQQAFMSGPDQVIELFHGYTYSAHPLAVAACRATLGVYEGEGLFERAAQLAPAFEQRVHAMRELPNVIDVRNYGLMGAVEMSSRDGQYGARGLAAMQHAFEHGAMVRVTGDTLAFSPPLIYTEENLDELFGVVSEAVRAVA